VAAADVAEALGAEVGEQVPLEVVATGGPRAQGRTRGVVTMAGVVGSAWLYRKVAIRTLSQVANQRTVRLSPLPGTLGMTRCAARAVVRERCSQRGETRPGAVRARPAPAAATEAAMPPSAGASGGAGAARAGGCDRP
jgi:hypothetical protein